MKKKKKNPFITKEEQIEKITSGANLYGKKLPLNELKSKNLSYNDISSNSWFDIKQSNFKKKYNLSLVKDNKPCEQVTKCMKINITFNPEQKEIINNWFMGCQLMYNATVKHFRKCKFHNEAVSTNFQCVRTDFMLPIKDEIMYNYNIPSHVLDGTIKQVCEAYKTAFTNFKNGNVKRFNIRYMKRDKKSRVMVLEKTCFKEKTFFTSFLGKEITNTNKFDYSQIDCDSKLHYNKVTNRYTLLVPVNISF